MNLVTKDSNLYVASTNRQPKIKKGFTKMINTIHVGIGPLGQKLIKFATQRDCFNIVGAVDNDPEKAGKDLGELCGIDPLGVVICNELNNSIRNTSAHVALVTTVSSVISMESLITELAKAKLNIVSTCEELFFPWNTHTDVSQRIDKVCRDNGVVCLGTGVNPGYMMDLLPSVLTGVCQDVEKVEVWRVQDASARRIPFQHKTIRISFL